MSELENKNTCNTDCGCGTQTNGYWQDVEQKVLSTDYLKSEFQKDEFDSLSVTKDRRSFLKIMGFSVSALPLTGCIKIPVKKALPYLNKQNDVIPGVANWYSSTFGNIPVLVKTREGRPIKIEGNDKSSTTLGGADAKAQASVLSLYDSSRLHDSLINGSKVEWDQFDAKLKTALEIEGKKYIVTGESTSSSELKVINAFAQKFNMNHVVYSSVSRSAMTQANKITNGVEAQNEYNFEKANIIVSFGADFLGTWGNSVNHAKKYASRRDVHHEQGLNRHYQVESTMSLTGANADLRYTRSITDQRNILIGIYSAITGTSYKVSDDNKEVVSKISTDLMNNKGNSLIVSGCNDVATQVVVNKINSILKNYGSTVNVYSNRYRQYADDAAFESVVKDMNSGNVGAVVFIGVNPAYDYYNSAKIVSGLKKVKTSAIFTMKENETSKLCQFVGASNHAYESWGDSFVSANEISFTQPVIQPLFGTRMSSESLMTLAGIEGSYYDYIKSFWSANGVDWSKALHDGVANVSKFSATAGEVSYNVNTYISELKSRKEGKGLNIVTYQKYAIGNGEMSDNPWLQELPDPVTKATWDNYAQVAPSYAKEHKLKSGDVVEISNGSYKVKLPVLVQPGTEKNTVAIAVGYGRTVAGKTSKGRGANAFGFRGFNNVYSSCMSFGTIAKTGGFSGIAQTQTHHSMEGRDIIRETTYNEYQKNPKAGNQVPKPKTVHIYPEHKKDGHQWAMSVDLNSCTGCSACIISCSTENNVPVVGKEEVANRREMHWLRLDRYYKGDENQPEVMNMPMLCQHCDNAPCENVCPVMATVQSSDGLNQQVYNRCVGTRYCANNCPYKVRRFNWFNYDRSDTIAKMAINPDVSIRTRGIMEKCTMCVHRIQEGKLTAKRERRAVEDKDIKLACQQSCPSNAIVFGDLNNPNSNISKRLNLEPAKRYKDPRSYEVLSELNVQPRVSYLTKIRNK